MGHFLWTTSLLVAFASVVTGETTVVQVTVVNRHGDRVPLDECGPNANQPCVIPKDKVDWVDKLGLAGGQLTGLGMDQCLALGAYLANKYVGSSNLLDPAFQSNTVRSWSTPIDRTLMSERRKR
jgi:hypothetical protein